MWNNFVMFVGNIGKEPEVKFTPSGKATLTFSMAVSQGKDKESTWLNVRAWDKTAENASEVLHKGSKVVVTGRVSSRSWEGDDGKKKTVLEVVADTISTQLDGKTDGFKQYGKETTVEDMPF